MSIDFGQIFDIPGDAIKFALKQVLGFEPPTSLVRFAMMLDGDPFTVAQQAVDLWNRMEARGFDPWTLLGQILDGIAGFGPGGYVRDRIRDFWRPIWHAVDMLDTPSKNLEAFVYAAQDALKVEMERMLEGQQAQATDQVSVDNLKMQQALHELATRCTRSRQANETLRDALQYYIPDGAGLIANGLDLVEVILFVAAIIDTGGIALIATPEVLGAIADEDYDIYVAGIQAGYDALGAWLLAQNLDLNPLPREIAEVAANPPPPLLPVALTQDTQILQANGCPINAIKSFMSNGQITQGYIHEIVQYHPKEACVILTDIDRVLRNGNQMAIGGLVATEDDLRQGGITYTGALFQIQWMAAHETDISGIEIQAPSGDRPDVTLNNGTPYPTIVDCKSVQDIDVSDIKLQVAKYRIAFEHSPIEYVFNGDKLLGSETGNLKKIQALIDDGVAVDLVFSKAVYDNPQYRSFIDAAKAKGAHIEVFDQLVIES